MKLIPLRLIALISLLFSNLSCLAAQNAVIRAEKAFVYSDLEMSTIIGFIPQGRQIRVGSNPRNQNSILPIVVSGKVGYIKISDILLESDNPHLKQGHSDIETDVKMEEERWLKNAGISLNFFPPGADFSVIAERVNGVAPKSYAKTYRFYTTVEIEKTLLRASLDSFAFSEGKLSFAPLVPALDYLIPVADFFNHHHLYGALGVIFPLSFNGESIWGIRLAPEWVYDLPYNLQVLAAVEYHYFKASGANAIYFSPDTFIVNNFGFNFGLQYRF